MGLLDFLTGNSPSFSADPAFSNSPNPSLWGALNQVSPLQGLDAEQRMEEAAAIGGMGIDPNNTGTPQVSPFTVAAQPAPAPAAPPNGGFGAGATPFGFAGPGSNAVNPSQIAPPSPIGPPAPPPAATAAPAPQVAAAPAPQAAPPAAPDAADPIAVGGGYQMPRIGSADSFEPDDAATPANAKPAQGMLPVGAPGAPSQSAPFSLGGVAGGIGPHLSAGIQSMNNTQNGGLVGKLTNGLSGLITGERADPTGVALALQNKSDNATAQALLSKGAPAADVAASIKNPALQKALIDQYYGKDKWQVVQVGENDGTKVYKQQNQVDGTLRDIPGVNSAGGGANDFVTGPDGTKIPIPAGVNRKEFIKRVTEASADGATGKATESQAKASSFAARMTQAEGVLGGLQNQGLDFKQKAAGEIPMVGNYMQSPDYQKYKQASSAFITALLRQESGAAINKSEFDRYEKELFPQPGDDAQVVAQKAAQRAAAIQQMSRAAGPGYKAPAPGGTVNVGGAAINWSVK